MRDDEPGTALEFAVQGPVTIESAINASGNAALDDSQEWQLVPR
jgi:hypothetical protein